MSTTMKMEQRRRIRIHFLILAVFLCKDVFCVPLNEGESNPISVLSYSPEETTGERQERKESDQTNSKGAADVLVSAIKEGAAAFPSPTMILGGFSMLLLPMPKGVDLAGQVLQTLPQFANFIPGIFGSGRKQNATE